ncbi:MAG TPA: 23S rRNA (adenine(2030)-N(6))-methyltransferase RlmJ [Gammaproteobacteria bacterium]|nr:23S rRNA (adenine(2030)-N(6))-methyltransferase RlmJ [Gammaproteobacteria bacterium]
MLSYQHKYHAGNYSDLHKHITLIALLEHLRAKEAPFCVLDAYAGDGLYDLHCPESQKNLEHEQGFMKLTHGGHLPTLCEKLMAIAKNYQNSNSLFYPGSPAIIQYYLRNQDSAHLVEKHPQSFKSLKCFCGKNPKVHIHQRDSIEALSGLLPFKEKRGIIFIDPSYEVKSEYRQLGEALLQAHHKFGTGIFLIWYPLLKVKRHLELIAAIKGIVSKPIWQMEWFPFKSTYADHLIGSGLVLINPPWQVDQKLTETFNHLMKSHFLDAHLYTTFL